MKNKLTFITQFAILILTTSLLLGCYDKEEFKHIIQNGYDEARSKTKVKGDFCYYLGSVKFPYTDEPMLEDDIRWVTWNKEDLAKSLPLFAEIGLLTRKPVEGQPGLYDYDLTDLGREYQHLFPKQSSSGRIIYHNAFCYGPIVVEKVTDVAKKEYTRAQGYNRNEVNLEVKYQYHVINVPDWAIKNQDKINAVYGKNEVMLPERSYRDTITFYVGEGGKLYEDSLSYKRIKPRSAN
jgi:hypothetical protein